jgi:small GTP-binding protein
MEGESVIKTIFVGNSGVGKTAIATRACSGTFSAGFHPTIAATHLIVRSSAGNSTSFSVWDTAGQDQYRSLIPMYSRGADIALVVFDLTVATTFDAVWLWVAHVRENAPDCQIYLIGNKSDLRDRAITIDHAQALANEIGAVEYVETSAATGAGISDLFERLADRRPPPPVVQDQPTPVNIVDIAPKAVHKSQCGC